MARRITLKNVQAARSRWETRLFRAASALQKIKMQEKRLLKPALMKAVDEHRAKYPRGYSPTMKVMGVDIPVTREAITELPTEPVDDLSIPAQFKRAPVSQCAACDTPFTANYYPVKHEADEKAKAEILAQQAEKQKKRATASKAKSKAKLAGQLRKMPLQGKAALAVINAKD